jgi:hypothetical protein
MKLFERRLSCPKQFIDPRNYGGEKDFDLPIRKNRLINTLQSTSGK